MAQEPPRLFTIGHSNRSLGELLGPLRRHRVEVLVDVRSRPFSRFGHFSRGPLERAVVDAGMVYRFMGDVLGGKPDPERDPALYDADGKVRYDRVAALPDFKAGIERLAETLGAARTAILCAEEDPTRCHRRLLVTPALLPRGVEVLHIRRGGEAESEAAVAARGKVQLGFF